MKNRLDKAAAKLWNQFIGFLCDQGIKEESVCWSVMRAEHYLAAFSDQCLAGHSASNFTEHLSGARQKKAAEILAISASSGCYTDFTLPVERTVEG